MSARLRNAMNEIVSLPESHIAGIVVHVSRTNMERIKQAILLLPGSEIHAVTDAGKIVVTLEADLSTEIINQMDAIHALDGVYSAALVYQHHEVAEALDQEIGDAADTPKLY